VSRPWWFALLLLSATCASAQDELALADLGDLDLAFAPVQSLERVPGPNLRASVHPDPGAAYRVLLPANVQRSRFRVAPGAPVAAGDPVVRLEGAEIHHWLLEYDALRVRFETAKRRYERNRPLYEDRALPEADWADIQERYFALRLESEHMAHFHEWLLPSPEEDGDALVLGAPVAGIVMYDSGMPALDAGDVLLEILPEDGLRLRVEAPAARSVDLTAVAFGDCEVAIERVEGTHQGLYRRAWSRPLVGACTQAPGAVLSVRPYYRLQALQLPRAAVFQWRRTPHVWLRQGERLLARPVRIVADTPDGYAVAAEAALENGEVLVRSVSAAQGMLLGLGGE